VEHFAPAARGQLAPVASLRDRPRPRLGFVGNIESRLDLEAAAALARGPGSLTLIGPAKLPQEDEAALRAAGAHLEGAVPYEDLPAWLAGFDIAVLPYRRTELVLQSRPLKLLEYLAAGLPVVASDIPAARELAPHVRVARTPEEYVGEVAELWEAARDAPGDEPARRIDRLERVRGHSWADVAQSLRRLLASPSEPPAPELKDVRSRVEGRVGTIRNGRKEQ
jgi:glycosyltransferase involved in cell wall biosynthesis